MGANEEIKECYKVDDDNQAMTCIKKVVQNTNDNCKPRIVLLYQDHCEGCKESKDQYKNEIAAGVITPIDFFSSEGKEIAKRNDIAAVPALLILDCQNNAIV